jgi:hypothetical protein
MSSKCWADNTTEAGYIEVMFDANPEIQYTISCQMHMGRTISK